MAGSLKESETRFLSSNPKEICDRLKFLRKEIEAGNSSDIKFVIDKNEHEYLCNVFTK